MEKKDNIHINQIIGQETLKNHIIKVFDIFVRTGGYIKPHFIITGGSGTGKTFIVSQLSKAVNISLLNVNASQITKEGISGNSLSKVLRPIAGYKGRPCICFIDEFDKLFITGNGNQKTQQELSSVQNELLKIVEDDTTEVYDDYGKYMTIDISRVLFIFAGAFNGDVVNVEYLLNAGVKTEFLGRVNLIFRTDPIDLEKIISSLNKNVLLKAYKKLYPDIKVDDVIDELKPAIVKNHTANRFGLRMINSLIHEYFIFDGLKNAKKEEKRYIDKFVDSSFATNVDIF